MRSLVPIGGLIMFVLYLWFGSWFDNATDKALAKCTVVEQMRDECSPSKMPDPGTPPPR